MFDEFRDKIISFITSRLTVFTLLFFLLGGILIYRCFELQIVQGQQYLDEFVLEIEKTRDIPSTRGNIYDRNGNVMAYNELAYSVKIEDVFESGRSKNANLNEIIYSLIQMIEKTGISVLRISGFIWMKTANSLFPWKIRLCSDFWRMYTDIRV